MQGGYWSLEKRQDDLHKMEQEWQKTLAVFSSLYPDITNTESVQVRWLHVISSVKQTSSDTVWSCDASLTAYWTYTDSNSSGD